MKGCFKNVINLILSVTKGHTLVYLQSHSAILWWSLVSLISAPAYFSFYFLFQNESNIWANYLVCLAFILILYYVNNMYYKSSMLSNVSSLILLPESSIYTVADDFFLRITCDQFFLLYFVPRPRPSGCLSTWNMPCSVERWCGTSACWRRATACVTVRRVTPTPSWPSTAKRRTPSTFTEPAWWEHMKETL